MPQGGTLTLKTGIRSLDEQAAAANGANVGDYVVVSVADTGVGMSADIVDRVFEPFHRGEPSRSRETGGVGLGLPIARNIFRAHGGDVTLVNRPAGGAKATATLPA